MVYDEGAVCAWFGGEEGMLEKDWMGVSKRWRGENGGKGRIDVDVVV